MKKIFSISIFLIWVYAPIFSQECVPNVYVNSLDITIDFETGMLNVGGLDCDPCELGYEGNLSCTCHEECQNVDYEDCHHECQHEFGSVDIAHCEFECAENHGYENWEDYLSCSSDCGEIPNPNTEAIQFEVSATIYYTTGYTETFDGQPQFDGTTPRFFSQTPSIIELGLNHDFPNEPISYCYIITTVVFYEDGTCCLFYDFACFNLG